jgi:hypothetical protein
MWRADTRVQNRIYPIDLQATLNERPRRVKVINAPATLLASDLCVFVDHVYYSANSVLSFALARARVRGVDEVGFIEDVCEYVCQKQWMPIEYIADTMPDIAHALTAAGIILAAPFSRNRILDELFLDQNESTSKIKSIGVIQSRVTSIVHNLDPLGTYVGGEMWDIGVKPEEIIPYMNPEDISTLYAWGIEKIRLLRVAADYPDVAQYDFSNQDIIWRIVADQLTYLLKTGYNR